MEPHRPRHTESKHELGKVKRSQNSSVTFCCLICDPFFPGSCLCQLWLHCASVGCGEGNLRPHIDQVDNNDGDPDSDNGYDDQDDDSDDHDNEESNNDVDGDQHDLHYEQAQRASVQRGLLALRQVPCQRQLWQVRHSFNPVLQEFNKSICQGFVHMCHFKTLFVSFPSIYCFSGVCTYGALRVVSWSTHTGALEAFLRCFSSKY